MKLRNKKTGEIMDDVQYRNYSLSDGFGFRMNGKEWEYHSLAELNAEWEDYYEESEECWFIRDNSPYIGYSPCFNNAVVKYRKEIGNYFNTREEAEKVVEKLKAVKRLKDKDFDIFKYAVVDSFFCLDIYISGNRYEELKDDLKIVFGGKE